MKRFIWGMLFLLVLVTASAAEASYPPPPPAGKALSVEDSIYGVLRNHHNLRGMIENREVLDHKVRQAQAGFGPRVDVTGQAGGSVLSDTNTRNQNLDPQMWGKVGYSAQLVQPIWDGFATRSRVRSAKSALESQKYRVFDAATSLSLDAIIAHIDLLRRRKIYALSEENVAQHKSLVGQAQDRANLGADTAADVTQAQSRMQRALSSLSEARAALLVAEETYTRLTGLPAASRLQPVTMPRQIFVASQVVMEKAQESNPKLAAYLQDIRASRAERELADSAFSPSLNLEAGPSYTNMGGASDRWVQSFDVMGVVRWNIFNSGADMAARRAASASMRQSRQVMYNFIDDLKLDVDSTWVNYQAAQEQYSHYSKAVEYNKYTRTAYTEQFQIGKRSILDVLDTESELYNSATQAETARGNILVGAYRLSALTGNMLPEMSINTGPLRESAPKDPEDPREEFAPGWFN